MRRDRETEKIRIPWEGKHRPETLVPETGHLFLLLEQEALDVTDKAQIASWRQHVFF